jgi:hypothetical protein
VAGSPATASGNHRGSFPRELIWRLKFAAHEIDVIGSRRDRDCNRRVRGARAETRRAFPQRLYRRRALIESVFSSAKRKLSARAPGRTLRMQGRQALLLGLSFNLYRLRHRKLFLRMSTEPVCFQSPSKITLNSGNGTGILREYLRLPEPSRRGSQKLEAEIAARCATF